MVKEFTYTEKFYMVSYASKDNAKFSQLFIGATPEEALRNAKKANIGYKNFKVGKTAYNTLGEKFK